MNSEKFFLVYLIAFNLITFVVYGIDKLKAKNGQWRIRESTLIILTAIGGSVGALSGMLVFHHKTKKPKFIFSIPIILIVHIVLVILAVKYSG